MFTNDTRTETFLTQMGVSWSYTNRVEFGQLAKNWMEFNLARPVPTREEIVLEYAALMESGSPAPAPILHATNATLDVLDGVQRLAAAQLSGTTQFSAYVVTCDSDTLVTAINVLANARLQGRAEPAEWTRRRAIEVLIVEKRMTFQEVARMGGWPLRVVEKTARALDWFQTIVSIGGPELPDNMLDTVSKYTTPDKVRSVAVPSADFFNLVKRAKFNNGDAEPYIREFFLEDRGKRLTFGVLKDRLEDFKSDPEVITRIHGRKSRGLSNDIKLMKAIKTVETALESIETSSEPVPFLEEFFRMWNNIDKRLRKLQEAKERTKK